MTKTISAILGVIIVSAVLATYAIGMDAYADTRDRSAGRGTEPVIPPPPSIIPTSTPPPSGGGITSQTTGSVSTGGNTGGQVTTGDEHVEVYEINIGPTNSPLEDPEPVEGPPPPTSEPPCGSDGRTRTTCPTDSTRAR